MKTVTIDFELYQKELVAEHDQGYSIGFLDGQNESLLKVIKIIGLSYDQWKDMKLKFDKEDCKLFGQLLDLIYPDFVKKKSDELEEIKFTLDDIPF